jgi:DNA polymerase-4
VSTPARRIAHLDMDAFYASVGLLRYSELRGRPVVIGGRNEHQPVELADGSRCFARLRDYVGRGVITTATYEARALGVCSGMAIMKAARLAPDAILLPVDFAAYRHYSSLFKTAVGRIAAQIEDRGIDEIYIDLSAFPDPTRPLALRIKEAVRAATGLSCSIGVAANKLLAKICSDLDKPDGLTVLGAGEIAQRIWPLAVSKINGIGPRASESLAALGVHTIGDQPRDNLRTRSASARRPRAPGGDPYVAVCARCRRPSAQEPCWPYDRHQSTLRGLRNLDP